MSLKQKEIKFKPRIKLNHNIYLCECVSQVWNRLLEKKSTYLRGPEDANKQYKPYFFSLIVEFWFNITYEFYALHIHEQDQLTGKPCYENISDYGNRLRLN